MITRQLTEDGEELLPDGQVVRIPMLLMDDLQRAVAAHPVRQDHGNLQILDGLGHPAGHAPGYCFATVPGDTRSEAYREYVDDLSNAWKQGSQAGVAPVPVDRSTGDAREDYIKRLENAWRNS